MSFLSVLLPPTGLLLLLLLSFMSSVDSSESSVPHPVTCVTRGADLMQDRVVVLCPPDCTQWRGAVFGTGIYASVSSVCGAAVHRGVLGPSGGPVRVHKLQGRHNYMKSYAHGIQSQPLTQWSASFSLTNCQMDIAMVIDSSNNIGQRRFNLQKNFVAKLAAMLRVGPIGPHVGLIQASDSPRTEFLLTNYTQPKELMFAIKEVSYLGGNTNTGKAIMQAAESFFIQENGGRRGHPRVMMVLLDGWPSDDLEQAAMLARESGINVFLVSVARPAPEELAMVQDKDFMKKAVCKDNGFFSYLIPSWFSTTKHVKPLSQRLCSLDGLLCNRFINHWFHIFCFSTRRTGPGRNFLIVVTDGQSYDDVTVPALEAQKQGITIYSVGVAWAPVDDLRAMSSQPKDGHTFFTREFTGLTEFIPLIVRGICRDFTESN
nr:PREDICTED: cochlin-like [Paralichthys olivaceus]